MRVETALAYSCNCFVAYMAERLERDEPAKGLASFGLASRTGLLGGDEAVGAIASTSTPDAQRLQALGESGIVITAVELAVAYRRLARMAALPEMQPILAGLEGAVEYGTAQRAAIAGARVAGKTGTSRSAAGDRIAWFAGFLPSRAPEVVVTVMLAGHSGGADAAPVAGEILEAYRKGRL
jgi:cell division protein FtsI/penicillin-binding protein 2